MMRKMLRNSLLFVFALALSSCVRDELEEPFEGEGSAMVEIGFGFKDFSQVKVETRATLDIIPESRISNMFVMIFLGEKRYYAHYFDKTSLSPTLEDMRDESTEAWWVSNRTESVSGTTGTLRIHAPLCSGAEVYMIANIDSDMVNISPDKLNMISTRSELKGFVATLNQEITSRNGLFPMTGTYTGNNPSEGPATVDITETGIYPHGKTEGRVSVDLERMDAKVIVDVRIATDYELTSNDGSVTTVQRLKAFNPESWQVVNLPKGCFLAAHNSSDPNVDFFSTDPVLFETVGTSSFTGTDGNEYNSPVNGFSFYMLENRKSAKNKVDSFHERERRDKDAAGQYVSSGEVWTNAPESGTYMVIKGEVVMQVDVSSEAKRQQLAADVTYYVHLGDIANDLNDYNVLRNTEYTYTITIKGVNNIELEVSSSNPSGGTAAPGDVVENEPGAEGMVYTAKESIHTFDAHYGQRVFCFDADYIDPAAVTWYVKTPFGREGTPDKIGDTEIPSGMDYKWVHFMVNEVSQSNRYEYTTDGGKSYGTASLPSNPYSRNNRPYPGDSSPKLMDVVEFVDYIKAQKRNKDAGLANDFRTEFDQDWLDWYNKYNPDDQVTDPSLRQGKWFRDRIYVTVFVDEFYYESDPITGESDPQLWKRFVNQPNRLMHVLCDNQKSLDKASSSTGSVVTIRQRSIQTPYNVNDADLVSAWGCETEDENADSYLWYYPTETDNRGTGMRPENLGNTSTDNGLYNTVRIWGCVTGSSWKDVRWDDYLEYDRPDDYRKGGYNILFLRDDKACLKYSAMMRNRDNNGNGVIDPDEVRWYTASIGQLEYLFFGELGLSDDAKLFPRKYSGADGTYDKGHPFAGVPKWKCHVVSSTKYSTIDNPQILWAEEGVSVSSYKQWPNSEMGPYVVKCVRNLGFKTEKKEDFFAEDNRPQDLIEMIRPSDATITSSSVFKFDNRRVNEKSKRFRTSIELEPYDENSEMARLYDGFETGVLMASLEGGISGGYLSLRKLLQSGGSPCPDGYRVPNIREVALMYLMTDEKNWWKLNPKDNVGANDIRIFTSTYYSLGALGNRKNENGGTDSNGNIKYRYSWNTSSPLFGNEGNINLNGDICRYIRCVRDWDPATSELP